MISDTFASVALLTAYDGQVTPNRSSMSGVPFVQRHTFERSMIGRTSARPKLVEPTGFDGPARADLALAVAANAALIETAGKLHGAEASIEEAVSEARRGVVAAEEKVEEAKVAASAHLIANAIGDAGEPPITIKAARQALVEAEDALTAAKAAKSGLAEQQAQTLQHASFAARRVREAAIAVIAQSPAVARVLADVQRLQRELADVGGSFLWLSKNGAMPLVEKVGSLHGLPEDEGLRHAQQRFYTPPIYWNELIAAVPGAAPWEAAVAALQVDANAPLPGDN